MSINIAINGFGRIGRLVTRCLLESEFHGYNLQIKAINDLGDWATNLHLLQYDSTHGIKNYDLQLTDDDVQINGQRIRLYNAQDPRKISYKNLNIDIVLECSGAFTSAIKANYHLAAGAKKVLISAPCHDADITVVYGINHDQIAQHHQIISNASCTTNCLAPVAKVLHDTFHITKGFMTTIHAYTNDQRLQDNHHEDWRRARAATHSMIPTTTGAAKNIGLIIPQLAGKIDGSSVRVPIANVSVVDLSFTTQQQLSVSQISQVIISASQQQLKGVLGYSKLPLVSNDFNHNSHSAVVDLLETYVIGTNFARILAWYDNEWAFAKRMIDVTNVIASLCK